MFRSRSRAYFPYHTRKLFPRDVRLFSLQLFRLVRVSVLEGNDTFMLQETLEVQKTPRRSRRVITTLLAAAAVSAVALTGCSRSSTARCVDASGNVLPDAACPGGSGGGGYVGSGYHGAGGGGRWVYGGGGGTSPGSRATGFSTSAPSSENSSPSGTTVRGGFGDAGEGHGGGEGGGHGGGGGE